MKKKTGRRRLLWEAEKGSLREVKSCVGLEVIYYSAGVGPQWPALLGTSQAVLLSV